MRKTLFAAIMMLGIGTVAINAQGCCAGKGEGQKTCAKGNGSALENIFTRTSVRKFQDKAVEADKVETMLRAAMSAPTAVNKQPWHFVVVDDRQVLSQLGGQGRRGDMLRNAPLAIVVCGDMSKALDGDGREFWIQDTSAATENLLLAAHAMGLGAVWTSSYPVKQRYENVQATLGLPQTVIPLCVVVVGYPAEQPTPKDKWKPENISYNKFGTRK